MKKHFILTILLAFAVICGAQTSCWDGTAEPFDTSHAGTADDPILIENAEQLAYLSQNGHQLDCQYYKLMKDIDLDNRDWLPIGYYSSATSTVFNGYFDGNDHTLYHLTTTLFWWMDEGYIKNLTIKDSEIVLQYGLNCFGGMVNSAPLVENCHNYGDVILDYEENNNGLNWTMGGIAGKCETVKNCSNHGNMMVNAKSFISRLSIGGLTGYANIVEKSYNTGEITIDSEIRNYCYMGGICGEVSKLVKYCYNTVNMYTDNNVTYIGGIVGNFYKNPDYEADTLVIAYCYNAGDISAENVGGVISKNDYENNVINADNSYYINTIASTNNYGIPKSEAEMKSQDFVDLLNNGGNVYTLDIYYVNNGFPIFSNDITYPVIGTEWYYEILNDNGSVTYQYLECAADTTIDNKRAKVIIKSNTLYDKDLHTKVTHEYVYSENGIVYWWDKQSQSYTTLYDFNANVGDQWTINVGTHSITMHVDEVNNVEYNGATYRVLTVRDADDIFSGDIICGIGHTTSFFPEKLLNNSKDYRVEGMRCYWIDGEQLLHFGDVDCEEVYVEHHDVAENTARELSVYPNPAKDILIIKSDVLEMCHGASLQEYTITNITGQIMMRGTISSDNQQVDVSNLENGMYFIKVGEKSMKFIKM